MNTLKSQVCGEHAVSCRLLCLEQLDLLLSNMQFSSMDSIHWFDMFWDYEHSVHSSNKDNGKDNDQRKHSAFLIWPFTVKHPGGGVLPIMAYNGEAPPERGTFCSGFRYEQRRHRDFTNSRYHEKGREIGHLGDLKAAFNV